MAVVTVSATDNGGIPATTRWAIPPENAHDLSPIPRAVRHYGASVAVAALGIGDVTNVNILFTFPAEFIYLCKLLTIQFSSDDLTTEFDNVGILEYRPAAGSALGVRKDFELLSSGPAARGGTRVQQAYRPMGTWRDWINGPDGDTIRLTISDISADVSTAGDVAWHADFWEYDIEQCFKWPINTPAPQFSY